MHTVIDFINASNDNIFGALLDLFLVWSGARTASFPSLSETQHVRFKRCLEMLNEHKRIIEVPTGKGRAALYTLADSWVTKLQAPLDDEQIGRAIDFCWPNNEFWVDKETRWMAAIKVDGTNFDVSGEFIPDVSYFECVMRKVEKWTQTMIEIGAPWRFSARFIEMPGTLELLRKLEQRDLKWIRKWYGDYVYNLQSYWCFCTKAIQKRWFLKHLEFIEYIFRRCCVNEELMVLCDNGRPWSETRLSAYVEGILLGLDREYWDKAFEIIKEEVQRC